MASPQPPDTSRVIYTAARRSKREAVAHSLTRTAFLRHVVADSRTRDLFAYWGHSTGVDAVVDEMIRFWTPRRSM